MSEPQEELTAAAEAVSPQPFTSPSSDIAFRRDLAFPRLGDEMLQRLGSYGQGEVIPEDSCLYTYGDRDTDMLVVLSGGIESRLLVEGGGSKVFRSLSVGNFSGELNLLNSQRSIAEARTTSISRLLRISRKNLRVLMRAEGDIANIIVSACIWRRIGIIGDLSTGVLLRGDDGDPDLLELCRFLVRNYYPHRIEKLSRDGARGQALAFAGTAHHNPETCTDEMVHLSNPASGKSNRRCSTTIERTLTHTRYGRRGCVNTSCLP